MDVRLDGSGEVVADRLFRLDGMVAVVTGGAGMLGREHCRALAGAGATAVSLDLVLPADGPDGHPAGGAEGVLADVTDRAQLQRALDTVLARHGRVDILVNNAARNHRVEDGQDSWARFEAFPLEAWSADVAVGLTGAFLCSQVIGSHLAAHGGGVIVNVCSEYALIAPDQRMYRQPGLAEADQPVKPVSYGVVKHGLVGLTRYLATYWAHAGVRVNALSPGGVCNGQPADFVARLVDRVPLGRMGAREDFAGAVVFLCSPASSFMTGHNLVVDGGRTCW